MPIAGPDSHSSRKTDQIGERTPVEDPMEKLIETLREEFKRGLAHQQARKKATRRKRLIILISTLVVLAGIILTATLVLISIHPPH
jgi:hypothetical protein